MTNPGWMTHPLEPVVEQLKLPQRVLDHLSAWRAQWLELWMVRISGRCYVFRSPTRGEALIHDANAASSPAVAADRFVHDCVLEPEKLPDKMSLAEFDQLYRAIWAASGFRDESAFVERLRSFEELVAAPAHEFILVLTKAFPGLRPDEINSWQPDKIAYHVAIAKALLGIPPMKEKKTKAAPPGNPQTPPSPQNASVPQPPKPKDGRAFDWNKDLTEWEAFERSGG